MNWYIAKLVFQIVTGADRPGAQFDEHLRLSQAASYEQAFRKAKLLGIQEEDSVLTAGQEGATWAFVNITELYPLKDLADGAELYSQIHETPEGKSYIRGVHRRAAELNA